MTTQNLLRKQVVSETRKRRLIITTVILLSFLYLGIDFFFGPSGFLRYLELKKRRAGLESEIGDIEVRNGRLLTDLKRLKENPFYLEKHAREDFGMAKPDEYIFKYEQ